MELVLLTHLLWKVDTSGFPLEGRFIDDVVLCVAHTHTPEERQEEEGW